MMESGNPNWHNMQQLSSASAGHDHGHVQSNSSYLFSLLHHQLNLHGGPSNSSPSSSNSSSSSSTSSSSPSTSSLPFNPLVDDQSVPQDFPQSWSQLLMSGLASGSEEERLGLSSPLQVSSSSSSFDHPKVTPNNESLLFGYDHHQHHLIKQEGYGHGDHSHGHDGHDMNQHHEVIHDHQMHSMRPSTNWSHMVLPVSSPKSCVTTLSSNHNNINTTTTTNTLMDFSSNSCKSRQSECNSPSATTGGAPKKPRVQSSSIPPLKVRKEKLGDRITALHQLVSPFGKTDTASVLLETIGCIRFLQGQIQALSSPYLGNPPYKNHHFNHVMKDEALKDLRSKGLCLVPISSTQLVGSNNNTASEYWAPSIGGGF